MRYFQATIICAIIAAAAAIGLREAGAFLIIDAKLSTFLRWPATPDVSRGVQYTISILLAIGVAWTTIDIVRPVLKAVIAALAFGEVLLSVWVANALDGFFSPFAPATAIAVAFLCGLAYSLTGAGRRKNTLHHLLGDRVSPSTFSALLNGRDTVKFNGEMRDGTVMVCELFNHEELMSALRVPDYVEMTNLFLRNASDFLVERGAYLDECDGESLRAIFGAPLANPRHAAAACEAALALSTRLDAVNRECQNLWGQRFDFRIGINAGEMVMAAYGSERLSSISVAGEPVEFARRLCSANTIYGSRILIGNGAFVIAEGEIEVRPIELIQRSQNDPAREEVYELVGMRGNFGTDDRKRRDVFWKGIVLYREHKWDEALAAFKTAVELGGGDEPAEFYIRRIEQIRAGLPSLDWASARA